VRARGGRRLARLLGAHVVVPAAATGDVDTDLSAKAAAAASAVADGASASSCTSAARTRPRTGARPRSVVDVLEQLDVETARAAREVVGGAGGRLIVCPDHGTDPAHGTPRPRAVPAVVWGARVEPLGRRPRGARPRPDAGVRAGRPPARRAVAA
jgi:2,3-bisphosphoglycerate-independent phosphoglycerate mutase